MKSEKKLIKGKMSIKAIETMDMFLNVVVVTLVVVHLTTGGGGT